MILKFSPSQVQDIANLLSEVKALLADFAGKLRSQRMRFVVNRQRGAKFGCGVCVTGDIRHRRLPNVTQRIHVQDY